MNVTKHAAIRSQQRGIPPIVIEWVRKFGQKEFDHRGAVTRYLDKDARKTLTKVIGSQVIRQLETFLDVYVIESTVNGGVITTGHRYKRINRT